MSKQRKTCHGCQHLKHEPIAMGGTVAYCGETGGVVPHHFQSDPVEHTYWRVPMNCPLPDTEVLKRENKAPRRDWVTVKGQTA